MILWITFTFICSLLARLSIMKPENRVNPEKFSMEEASSCILALYNNILVPNEKKIQPVPDGKIAILSAAEQKFSDLSTLFDYCVDAANQGLTSNLNFCI